MCHKKKASRSTGNAAARPDRGIPAGVGTRARGAAGAGAGARAAAAGAAGAWRKRGFGAAAGVDCARSTLVGKDFTRRRASEQSVRGESGGNQ